MSTVPAVEMQRLFARTEELWNSNSDQTGATASEMHELFRRTKDLTVELMRDSEQLRVQNLLLERQKIEAEQRLDHSRLGKENEQLRAELQLFNERLADMEKKTQNFRRRYEDIEQYNTALSNVYVASNKLHSTLDFTEIVKTAGEILWNLIAASSYAIFLRDEKTGDLMLVGGEGIEGRFPNDRIHEPTGMIAEALAEGISLFIDGEISGDPLACVPLKVDQRGVVGLITLYQIDEHKGGLSDLDRKLFELLASQTATAIASSRVYSETVKKLKSMESFVNLMS